MTLKAYFQDVTPRVGGLAALRLSGIVWHFAWALAILGGLIGLLFLPASPFAAAAMVVMTVPGAAAALLLLRDDAVMRRLLLAVWTLAALAAVFLTGGISGPMSAWVAMPLAAAVALNQRALISLGATLACGLTLISALISAFGWVRVPDGDEAFWLSLIATASVVVGLSVALLPALRQRVERTADAEEARARLLRMLTEQPQLILCLDEAGRVVAAYGEAPAGLDLNPLMQSGLIAAAHAPDRTALRQALDTALTHGRADIGFMPHAAMDHYLHLTLRRAPDDRLYGSLRDATLQHGREAALEAARAEAEHLNQGKTQFLAGMSHELRTPLNAVIGFSDIMRQQMFGPLSPKYAEYAQLIWESGQHVLDMINDVLDMSKIEAQKYQLSLESFDIREPVSQALRLMRGTAHDKAIDIAAHLPPSAVTVTADKRAIKQICLNLLSNAIKFTPKGGRISLALTQAAETVDITITDTGIGIAPDDLSRIGQPYEQSGTAEQKAMGTGLGLSLVKAFAHLHGGTMALSSQLGEGTTVRVSLPVVAHQEAEDPRLPLPEPESARPAFNPLQDYTRTPDTLTAFSDFVIRPPH